MGLMRKGCVCSINPNTLTEKKNAQAELRLNIVIKISICCLIPLKSDPAAGCASQQLEGGGGGHRGDNVAKMIVSELNLSSK